MAELSKREITEVIQLEKLPPGYFQNIVSRRKNWLGRFCYNLEGPRWNNLVPITKEGKITEIPQELLKIASQVGGSTAIYGGKEVIEQVKREMNLENNKTAFEMTYLVPTSSLLSKSDHELNYRKTTEAKVQEDFLDIFEIGFGEEKNGSHQVSEAMYNGIKVDVIEDSLGKNQISFVGYKNEQPISTGTITVKDGKCFLYNVATHKEHRNQGYGSEMTRYLIEQAKSRGVDLENIYIGTEPGTSVEEFYKSLGCKEVFKTEAVDIELSNLK
jgi:ribosomal protein S18 acetylase RimI-like enzyme